ncbi:MAG: F0F1 ATP synthase subunit A [Chloroflexota bacterium]
MNIPPLAPEALFHLGPLAVTNTILYTYFAIIVTLALAWLCGRRLQVVPEGRSWQMLGEVVIGQLVYLAETAVGRARGRVVFTLMAGLFCFIIVANWLSLLPIIGPIYAVVGSEHVPLFRSVNADWSMTLALAVITFLATEYWALRFRAKEHLKHFLWPPGIGQIELVSELVRMLSLSVRLFGNLLAGEVLVTVMTNLIPIFVPSLFQVLETLFGLIQALVFTVLCLAYFTLGTTSHEQEPDHLAVAGAH